MSLASKFENAAAAATVLGLPSAIMGLIGVPAVSGIVGMALGVGTGGFAITAGAVTAAACGLAVLSKKAGFTACEPIDPENDSIGSTAISVGLTTGAIAGLGLALSLTS